MAISDKRNQVKLETTTPNQETSTVILSEEPVNYYISNVEESFFCSPSFAMHGFDAKLVVVWVYLMHIGGGQPN